MEDDGKLLCIKQLIRCLGVNQSEFADKIGAYRSDMSKYLSGKVLIGNALLTKVIRAYPNINKDWLWDGTGEMFSVDINREKPNKMLGGTPYFDIESAACGSLSGYGSALMENNANGSVVLPQLKTQEGDVFLATRGRSMIDTECPERSIPEGAMVLVRKWQSNYIAWGEIYCVVTTDGYVIKRLMPGTTDDTIRCMSADSKNYPDFEILRSDVKAIGRVVAVVSTTTL